ncbi:MAG: M20/M25/M40 family metallo-hydrolase [Steroidobacteraceae bacterium]|jgi:acetylornithine deacetylase/succinyl-diaminopimelate desuccinylase-like protein
MSLNASEVSRFVNEVWDRSIVPELCEYVRIPNKSPLFDPDWERHGHMERAVELMADWCRRQPIAGLTLRISRLPGRTPLIFMEVPARGDTRGDTILLYGHLDKQPEFTGWEEGLGPWEPVLRDGRLYGRGGADDGYAIFSSLTAIAALQAQNIPHARCVVLIEACEESGSVDLPAHVEALAADIGTPALVVCLDAEAGDYERLWLTTSLRGNIVGTLEIDVLTEGVHSGAGSGIAASCFDVLRVLLSRLSDANSGELRLAELCADTPPDRRREIEATARLLGRSVAARMPFAPGVHAMSEDPAVLLENSTWKSTLTVTGLDGLPSVSNAGNVLAPRLKVKLSFRLPPTASAAAAAEAVRRTLMTDPPYGARVAFSSGENRGWNAPRIEPWLERAVAEASRRYFGQEAMAMGVGGTIPFMAMLGERFPSTQFLVTGVLGPHSNAHGPNEFLHIEYAKRLTGAVADIIARHALR